MSVRSCGPFVRRQAKGFQWVDDTTSYGSHRWGWVSERVGDWIDLKVHTAMHCIQRVCTAFG
jgi:hypothetical protein